MNSADIAATRFQNGYSCSQAVFSALAEKWNVPPEISLRIAAGFGGGIARCAKTCGCVTGAIMAIGLAQPDVSPEGNRPGKEKTCELGREFLRAFEERHGSATCLDLLGCDIGTPEGSANIRQRGLHSSVCAKLVRDAVEIVESMFPAAR